MRRVQVLAIQYPFGFMPNVCEDKIIEQLYRQHAAQLRNYLYYRCKNLERSNDLVQEAFSKLWEKCKEVVPKAAPSFLYTVARNAMLNLIKKDQIRFKYESEEKSGLDYESPEFNMEMAEFKAKLEQSINELPDGQREAFLMHRIDQLSYREIADRLDISVKAVEKRIHKALVKLRGILKEHAKHL
ncbi:MAG: RNA polymerase sigma factor [Balneolaceae bacterium]